MASMEQKDQRIRRNILMFNNFHLKKEQKKLIHLLKFSIQKKQLILKEKKRKSILNCGSNSVTKISTNTAGSPSPMDGQRDL